MSTHERNLSASINPVKVERLAATAVKIGLRLGRGAMRIAAKLQRTADPSAAACIAAQAAGRPPLPIAMAPGLR